MSGPESPYRGSYESPTGLGTALHARGQTEPVYRDSFFNTWVVLRRDDVLAAMRDTTTFTNGAYKFGPLLWSPVSLDGDAHAEKRRTYSSFFTPKAINHYRDLIEPIAISTAATHYDEAVYPDPETFDIGRDAGHLAFGFGPHYCIGAPLARLEARIALSKLVDRFPEMRLDPEERLTFCHNVRESALFGPERLPVLLNGEQAHP